MEIKSTIDRIRQESYQLRREARERTVSYIVASFGFVAGLAWNDAIKAFIEYLFPLSTNTLVAKLIYAVVITLVVVLLTSYFVRVLKQDEWKK